MAWKAFIERRDYRHSIDVKVGRPIPDGYEMVTIADGANCELQIQKYSSTETSPPDEYFLSFVGDSIGILQAIIDAAWEEGIRPSQHQDFKAFYDAQSAHLQDMRRLVAHTTGAYLPGTNFEPPKGGGNNVEND